MTKPEPIQVTRRKVELLRALEKVKLKRKIDQYFCDEGPYRRELYKKHLEFFKAGAKHKERLLLAGNRTGKTECACFELACHLTNRYPDWWEGRKFRKPIKALASGDTAQTTRDIIQTKLLGGLWDTPDWGTGMIPASELRRKPVLKQGIPNAYEELFVRTIDNSWSSLRLRSYDQGRRIFQGVELDLAWFDEEVPEDVYEEGLTRTMTTDGLVVMTFTPLSGMTPLVLSFLDSMRLQEPIAA